MIYDETAPFYDLFDADDPGALVTLVIFAFLLSLAMLSVGFVISACTRRASIAVGIGLFFWLIFVFLGDLGMMGAAITMQLPIDRLFWVSLANPLQVFKTLAILDIHATLDILGPVGIYAMQRYGDGLLWILLVVLVGWVVAPALVAYARFATKSDL